MTERIATCSCGQLRVTCTGEPVRISTCHCLACQQRTGSVLSVQSRFPSDRVRVEGRTHTYVRVGDSGGSARFSFCPDCGSTVCWTTNGQAETVAVAVGAFADPTFPAPTISVYEERKHPWVGLPAGITSMD